jgi:surface antigen
VGDIGGWAVIPAVPALVAALWGVPQPPAAPDHAVRRPAAAPGTAPRQALLEQTARRRGSGGYPYATAPCEFGAAGGPDCANPRDHGDSYDWGYRGPAGFRPGDPWGYEYRNCTSYVAWQLSRSGVRPVLFSDLGNATAWITGTAGESGVTVNRVPSPGAVAVWVVAAGVGHVAWVDSVRRQADGEMTVTVSDYNYAGTGAFDTHVLTTPPSGYIHFPRATGARAAGPRRPVITSPPATAGSP